MHHKVLSVCSQNVHSYRNCECSPNRINVFEIGVQLPGCSKVSQSVTLPCWLQLCSILRGLASKSYNQYHNSSSNHHLQNWLSIKWHETWYCVQFLSFQFCITNRMYVQKLQVCHSWRQSTITVQLLWNTGLSEYSVLTCLKPSSPMYRISRPIRCTVIFSLEI